MVIAICVVKTALLCIMARRRGQGEALTGSEYLERCKAFLGDRIYCLLHSVWASSQSSGNVPRIVSVN